MKIKTQLKNIASFSKGEQIKGDDLLENGLYDYLNGGICPSGKWDSYNTPANTVTISEGGNSCGYVNFMKQPFWCGAHCYYLFNTLSNTKYLYYVLKSQQDRLMKIRSGACMPNIKKSDLGDFEIVYETDELEQKRIVEILSKCEKIIVSRKQQLQQLDELVKARFVELFGDIQMPSKWDKKPWSDLVTIQNGKDYKKIAVETGGYPVYGTGGEMARASEYLCPENTVIVGRKGTINNPLLVEEKFWNVDTAFGVIVGNQLHYQYFYNFCKLFDFSTLNKQAVLPSTTKADLLKIEIAVPPIELQNEFANFVKEVDKSKFVEQKINDIFQFYLTV